MTGYLTHISIHFAHRSIEEHANGNLSKAVTYAWCARGTALVTLVAEIAHTIFALLRAILFSFTSVLKPLNACKKALHCIFFPTNAYTLNNNVQ